MTASTAKPRKPSRAGLRGAGVVRAAPNAGFLVEVGLEFTNSMFPEAVNCSRPGTSLATHEVVTQPTGWDRDYSQFLRIAPGIMALTHEFLRG